jgi:hypothetical protein
MVYSLNKNIAVLPDASGNITSVCMTNDCLTVYLSVTNGNVYSCDISNNIWSKSTGAAIFYNRAWRDIVCSSTGQYVCCLLASSTSNDPNGIIFYSTDYGNTFTKSQFTSSITNAFAPGGNGINLAMNNDGSILYYAHNPSGTAGYLYKSTDYGNTWSLIVTAGTSITVKTNNTGQYVIYGGNMVTQISLDYGATWRNTGGTATAVPKYMSNIDTNLTSLLQFYAITFTSGSWNAIQRTTFNVSNNATSNSNLNPFYNFSPPGSGNRYIASVNKQQILMVVDNPPSTLNGNIYITTNGASSLAQGSNGNVVVNFSNFTLSQGIEQSAWTGLKSNYNDSIVFSNKVGKVYIYSWTLQ